MGMFRVIDYDPYAVEFEAWIKRVGVHMLIDAFVAYTQVLLGNVETMRVLDNRSMNECSFGFYAPEDREAIAKIRLKVLARELANQGMWPWAEK
jgi:hypothetical protein